jgi:hypothetical protein
VLRGFASLLRAQGLSFGGWRPSFYYSENRGRNLRLKILPQADGPDARTVWTCHPIVLRFWQLETYDFLLSCTAGLTAAQSARGRTRVSRRSIYKNAIFKYSFELIYRPCQEKSKRNVIRMMATTADPMMLCPLIFIQQYFVMPHRGGSAGDGTTDGDSGREMRPGAANIPCYSLCGAQNADIAISNRLKSKRYCHGAGVHSKFSAGKGLHARWIVFIPAGARKGPVISPTFAAALLGGLQTTASPASGIFRIYLDGDHGASAICWPASSRFDPGDAPFLLRLSR